jgi:hypothetical protein
MATKVYGASDDLVEFDGDVSGEVGHYEDADDGNAKGVLIAFSDGSIMQARYGKAKLAVWQITALSRGPLFDRIDECHDEDADPHSDVAHFKDGIKWAYAAKDWERVQ